MDTNKISVIVPTYNIETYIEKTVDSIRKQSFGNLEIILVNDGSADRSGEIFDSLSKVDSRIKVVHQRNGGVTEARIAGIIAASGNWITFVDGDDYIEPDMYATLLENALAHNADISHCGYQMVFPSRVDYYYNTKKTVVQDNYEGLRDLLSGDFVEPGLWNKLIKAKIVKEVASQGLIDASVKINEDLLMNYYFFRRSRKSIYYDICPYHYVLRKGSTATSKINFNKLYDPIKVQNTILDDVKNDGRLADVVYGRLASFYISGASMNNPEKEGYIDEYTRLCRTELKKLKPEILNDKHGGSAKLKYRLCAFSPFAYRCFHTLYAKARGTDNRYEVK